MVYKHILVAVDLSPESDILVEKAVSMARPYNAKISLIHVGINYSDLYTGLVDISMNDMKDRITEDAHIALNKLAGNVGYIITHTLCGCGEFGQVLIEAIHEHNIDLVVCGHHQDFWSKLMSSSRQLINNTHVDTLIIPLKDDTITVKETVDA
ncbi:universal stress protein UspA [Orbus sturtevantii]|uniref:universal stress protein UspA n=1 Tax=Orbus sturtevantii TaxID=3074109 RepID=UPI00370D762B